MATCVAELQRPAVSGLPHVHDVDDRGDNWSFGGWVSSEA